MKKILMIWMISISFVFSAVPNTAAEYQKQCDRGELNACVELATEYIEGKNLAKNYEVAKAYLELACQYKNAKGCSRIGVLYIEGIGVNKDSEKAKLFFKKGCDLGSDEGCKSLSYLSEMKLDKQSKNKMSPKDDLLSPQNMQGGGVNNNANMNTMAADIKTYKKNCLKGDMESCYQVGASYNESNGVKHNLNLAKQFFDLSCEGGYYRACGALADVYRTEKFRDFKKAEHFAKIACDKEKENGCMVLGSMYMDDEYGIKNKKLAKQYFSKALKYSIKNCNQGIGSACYDAAWLYDTDVLNISDNKKAKQFYVKSCRLNSLDGCLSLAAIYQTSKGMKKAAELYRKICERYGGMCSYLAGLYFHGDGNLDKDPALAKKYYRKACELGEKDACDDASKIDAKRDPDFLEAPESYSIRDITYLNTLKIYKKECEHGNMQGCIGVGAYYIYGTEVKKDYARAKNFFNLACESNIAKGCYGVGLAYEKMNQKDKAILQYEHACKMGLQLGCKWAKKLK